MILLGTRYFLFLFGEYTISFLLIHIEGVKLSTTDSNVITTLPAELIDQRMPQAEMTVFAGMCMLLH
jgi:hypothetical protein